MEQLQVFNPNDGKWYEVGDLEKMDPEKEYLESGGRKTFGRYYKNTDYGYGNHRHPLTPCDPPKEFTLGEELLGFAGEKKDRVVSFGLVKEGNSLLSSPDMKEMVASKEMARGGYLRIILSPPAPEPKTDRDMVRAFVKLLNGVRVTNNDVLTLVDEAKAHLAAQSDTPE